MSKQKRIIITADEFFKRESQLFLTALGFEVEVEYELKNRVKFLDILVIKKKDTDMRDLQVFNYFSDYNLISYKSFNDTFKVTDIYDLISYLIGYIKNNKLCSETNSTASLIVTQKPLKFFKSHKAFLCLEKEGHYIVDYNFFKLHILNLEELDLSGIDGIFLSSFAKARNKIASFKSLQDLSLVSKKIVDILKKSLFTRLKYFEQEDIDMPKKVADITEVVMPLLEKAEAKGREEGREEGIEQDRYIIVQGMYNKGYTPEQISEITDFPLAKVEEYLKK